MNNQTYSGTRGTLISEREFLHSVFARNAAAEGMVLLKNEGLLPLEDDTPIALFGGGAVRTVKGGTGSGDVNNRETVSIYRGLKDAKASITSEDWLTDYEKRYESARNAWKEKVLEDTKKVENPFDAYSANPFSLPEGRRITEGDLGEASAAVYVVSRISGEGKDRRREEGDYYLSKKEREDILYLDRAKLPIVLVLNMGAPVELTDILQMAGNIRAILNISLPGQEGGHAAADVLFGRAVPGGRLTATWAKRYEDYPSASGFSYLNGNLDMEEYREGIYVGYRHFDSFGIEPLFPFGYGLSYTTFSITFEGLQEMENGLKIEAVVKNTGDTYIGREVVQVYVTPPQTGIAKEYQRLAGFAKTEELRPQRTQKLAIPVDQRNFAHYSEEMQAWVVERGTYGLWIGNHSASLQLAAMVTVEETFVLEQTKEICQKTTAFSDPGAAGHARAKAAEWMKAAEEQKILHFPLPLRKEKKNTIRMSMAEEYPVRELIPLLYGNITQGASTLGSAGIRVPGSAGETTEALEEAYGLRSLIMADGPAGLRLRQSYEVDRETGSVYGTGVLGSLENGFLEETKQHENADTYYQYCTAFPVGTALAQSWDMELMQKFGEAIAVKKSRPAAMMSAYNRINGIHAASNRDLCMTIAREEWGFEGVIMSDWNTTVPEDGSVPWQCAAAGNDIIMPGNQKDDKDIRRAYEEGKLSEEAIRACAGRVLGMIRKLAD